MSMEVKVLEQARQFKVYVGDKIVGRVTSYAWDWNEGELPFEISITDSDQTFPPYKTLRQAVDAVLDEHYGPAKIDKIEKVKA